MNYQNLKFLQDSFYQTQNICSWSITEDMQLLYSNCPEPEFFFNLFTVSCCCTKISEHFSHSPVPLIASDRIGFVWIAVLQSSCENEQVPVIHLVGPVFTSAMTDQYLSQHIQRLHPSSDISSRLWRFVRKVPAITSNMASCYASMLHFCVNQSAVQPEDIEIWSESMEHSEDVEHVSWGVADWHGDWTAEQQLFKSISEGRYVNLRNITTGTIGNIGGGDPLRQAKNQLIVFAVICSRAAINGGVSVEGSLNISDYFIQSAEAAKTVSEVENVGLEMYNTYIQRVRKAQANNKFSPLVRACAEYVGTHILKQITLKDMAAQVGYSVHYISHKFKSETGESLFDYIHRQKTELAKSIMKTTPISVAELSDRLAYSSPSYFSSVFKKHTGMSPVEYQNINHQLRPEKQR